jgi:hypothetical protein
MRIRAAIVSLIIAALFIIAPTCPPPPERVWRAVTTDGLGDPTEEGFWDALVVGAAQVPGGSHMFTISWNSDNGGRVFRTSDGDNYEPISDPGFGNPENWALLGLEYYQDCLYVSTWNGAEGGELWRSCDALETSPTWEQVVDSGFGNPDNHTAGTHVKAWGDRLLIGTFNPLANDGPRMFSSFNGDSGTWVEVSPPKFGLLHAISDMTIGHVFSGDGAYYVGVEIQLISSIPGIKKGCLIVRGSPNGATYTWEVINDPGFVPLPDGNLFNIACTDIDEYVTIINGQVSHWLYASTWNPATGGQLWRTLGGEDSISWEQIPNFYPAGEELSNYWGFWEITPVGQELFVAGWGRHTTVEGPIFNPVSFSRGLTVDTTTGGWLFRSLDGVNFEEIPSPSGGWGEYPQTGVNRVVPFRGEIYVFTQSWGFPGQIWVWEPVQE